MTKERLQYFRDYREKNREKLREYNKAYNSAWRKKHGYHNEQKWARNNPIKVLAQQKLRKAVMLGKIKKFWCEVCHSTEVVAHHDDYSKPLKVRWLCKIHHRQIHYGNNKGLKVIKRKAGK